MTFIWPEALLSLLLIPIGVVAWRLVDRRRRQRAAAAGGLGLTRATRQPARIRGRVPAALFLLGFVLLGIGLARPQAVLALPRQEGTVILCFDVSASMAADDLSPSRMEAAKQTAPAKVGPNDRQPLTSQHSTALVIRAPSWMGAPTIA